MKKILFQSIFFTSIALFPLFSTASQIKTCQLGKLGGFQPAMICRLNTDFIQQKNMHLRHNVLLLYGPTGEGKSRTAQEFAKKANADLQTYSGSLIVNAFRWSGVENIKEMFEKARKSQKLTVIFIENLDAFASDNRYGTIDDYVLAYKQFKIELDTLKKHPHIFVICTTNYIERIAPDVMRRFNGHVCEIKSQNTAGRKDLLKKFLCENTRAFNDIASVKEHLHKIMLQNYSENANNQLAIINADLDQLESLILSDSANHEKMLTILEKIHKALDEVLQNENLAIINNKSFIKEIERVKTAVQNILPNLKASIKTESLINEPIFEYLVNVTNGMSVALIKRVAADIRQLFVKNYAFILDKKTINQIIASSFDVCRKLINKKVDKTQMETTFDAPSKQSFFQVLKENPAIIIAMAAMIYAWADLRSPYEKIVEAKKKKKEQK